MKALVKLRPEKGIWMEDIPTPHVGINDVLIKIKKTAICGTDLHIYKWDEWSQRTIKTPMTIGHEYVGEIVEKMKTAGFDIKPTESAICAVMLYDAKLSQKMSALLLDEGIYVTGFYYPVVPKDQARIRVQISAAHSTSQLDKCIAAFTKVGQQLEVIK